MCNVREGVSVRVHALGRCCPAADAVVVEQLLALGDGARGEHDHRARASVRVPGLAVAAGVFYNVVVSACLLSIALICQGRAL